VPAEQYGPIADKLRAAIAAGEYAPGDKLPSWRVLMAREGITSNLVIRAALDRLRDEGLIRTDHTGTYVREYRKLIRRGIQRLGDGTWPEGLSVWSADVTEGRQLDVTDVVVTEQVAPLDISGLLQLDDDLAVIVRDRRYLLDGKPVIIASSWIPAGLARGTAIAQPDTGPGGSYARLAELGHAPVRYQEDIEARMPTPFEAERLALEAGTPVAEITRTAWDAGGMPVDVTRMVHDASAYIFRYEWDRT
jgi:GntR family transcriptional regulator